MCFGRYIPLGRINAVPIGLSISGNTYDHGTYLLLPKQPNHQYSKWVQVLSQPMTEPDFGDLTGLTAEDADNRVVGHVGISSKPDNLNMHVLHLTGFNEVTLQRLKTDTLHAIDTHMRPYWA